MSAGPFLSTTWFAPDQRATATAVGSLFCYLGGAAAFLVGPLVVPAPSEARLPTAVSNSSIRGRIQLVMYAGTLKTRGSTAPRSHITAAPSREANALGRRGSGSSGKTA